MKNNKILYANPLNMYFETAFSSGVVDEQNQIFLQAP